jgi:DNA-binding MurR/RpiR family transcriptional regulator
MVFQQKGMRVMLLDHLETKEDFTASEKLIADYILENPLEVADLTASELGERSFTSKATVLRLCKKLGVAGYPELQRRLELELNEKSRLLTLLEEEPVHKDSTLKDIVTIIPSVYDSAVTNTRLMLDDNAMRRIVNRLKAMKKIDIYGVGITHTCAMAAMFKFLSIGIECTAHSGLNEHYIMATRHDKKRAAIVVSFTGANQTMIQTARYLREAGTYVVGIGGRDSDELKQVCHEYIEIYSKELILSMEVLTPYIAITYVFDLLFAALLVANYDNNLAYALDVIERKAQPQPK